MQRPIFGALNPAPAPAPMRIPSPPPLYRFSTHETPRVDNPTSQSGQPRPPGTWQTFQNRASNPMDERNVQIQSLSSGPIPASASRLLPQLSTQVASGGTAFLGTRPHQQPQAPSSQMLQGILSGVPGRPAPTPVPGPDVVRVPLVRQTVSWLGEHPVSKEKYLYFCMPYTDTPVQPDTQPLNQNAPRLLASAPDFAGSGSRAAGTGSPQNMTRLLLPPTLQPPPPLQLLTTRSNERPVEAPYIDEEGGLLIEDEASSRGHSGPVATTIAPAAPATANAPSSLKRGLSETHAMDMNRPRKHKRPLSSETLPPPFPVSSASTTSSVRQFQLQVGISGGPNVASNQVPANALAPPTAPTSDTAQSSFTFSVGSADYVSPRLAQLLRKRPTPSNPNPNPNPSAPPTSTNRRDSSSAAAPGASARSAQRAITPEEIEAYARRLLIEVPASSRSVLRAAPPANPLPADVQRLSDGDPV